MYLIGGTLFSSKAPEVKDPGDRFRLVKTERVALGTADTAGGVLAWANPEGKAIIIERLYLDVTTKSTAACTLDVGKAADGTTSADNLLDGVDVGTATGLFDNITDKGTNGKSKARVAAGEYITASKASGAAAGLAGYAYIQYIVT